jgi:hypothetical protein
MRILRQFRTAGSTTFELLRGLWSGPCWWLVPLVALLLPAALIFVVLQSVPIVAPFVYTVF